MFKCFSFLCGTVISARVQVVSLRQLLVHMCLLIRLFLQVIFRLADQVVSERLKRLEVMDAFETIFGICVTVVLVCC